MSFNFTSLTSIAYILCVSTLILDCIIAREVKQRFDCVNEQFRNIAPKKGYRMSLILSCGIHQNVTIGNGAFYPPECYADNEMDVDANNFCPNGNLVYNFSKLDHLEVSNHPIQNFGKGFFYQFPKLVSLFLNNISLENEEDLGFTDKHSRLEVLHLEGNQLVLISKSFLCRFPMLRELNLASNQLNSIHSNTLDCLDKLEILNFKDNLLRDLYPGMFSSNLKLSSLDLSFNMIQHVPNGIFKGMGHLTWLSINNNQLKSTAKDAFHSIIKLEILDLSSNSLNLIPELNNVGNLALISLSNNSIINVKMKSYSTFNHLKTFWMENNRIEEINFGEFCQFSQLKQLSLAKNPIKSIAKEAFKCNGNLEELLLQETFLGSMSGIFTGPPLLHLDISISKIQTFSFEDIPHTLKTLILRANQIQSFASDFYDNPAFPFDQFSLSSMDMSNNRLTELDLQKLVPFSQLTTADFSDNRISKLTRGKFKTSNIKHQSDPNVMLINLRRNLISEICINGILVPLQEQESRIKLIYSLEENPMILCNCYLEYSHHFLEQHQNVITINDFDSLVCHREYPKLGIFPQKIKDLDQIEDFMCSSPLLSAPQSCSEESLTTNVSDQSQCPPKCQCYLNGNGTYLVMDCSGQNLTVVPGSTTIPLNVKILILYLDSNNLSRIYEESLEPYHHQLYQLYLNGSQVRTLDPKAFHYMNQTEVLNLNDNLLSDLPNKLFEDMGSLRELYLKGNRLTALSTGILDQLQNLRVLTLPDSVKLPIENLNQQQRISIFTTTGCNCDLYYRMSTKLLENSQNSSSWIECINEFPNGSEVFTLDRLKHQCPVETDNNWHQNTAILVSSFLVLLFLFSSSFLVFIYRQEIQVIIFVKYGIRFQNCRKRLKMRQKKSEKVFDAFISYSQMDEEFLVREFLPKLEDIENPYRLCLHHRNFMPGSSINENIIMAVKMSSRIIILLSENFVRSEWCRFEFRVGHFQMLKDHCPRVVIVSLGPCLPDDLDQNIKLYTKTKTYLEWNDQDFWKKLKFWLPETCNRRDSFITEDKKFELLPL